ncbi:unnamed protein product [Rotaria sp. Silwood2]|nr:unnamed protein product [Rotaria sp. Silwood2]CAF2747649.1 unnamed protein product [Rotaria sp. Silwood2]CAF3004365.1 unnamed protein product [Rotaria sp. Silwood2]CAF3427859.1 unnamed protein product [Rotaria sp. Silwood2]CAF3940991.1 unnamed protein product [Rotaria sp. Silwood2]
MASLALHLLTLLLGTLFIFLGHVKLTPQFFPEYHSYMKNEFGKFNKEFPFHRQTGWRPYARNFRLTIGVTEVACGFLLLIGFLQTLSNIILMVIMTIAIITFQTLNYPMEYMGVLICISFLLLLRFVLASRSKVKQEIKSIQTKVENKAE